MRQPLWRATLASDLVAGAFSMGTGEYISVTNQNELDLMSAELSDTGSDRRPATGELRPGRTRRASQRVIAVVAIKIAAAVNIAGCVVALLRHDPDFAVLTAVMAGSLTLAVTLLARLAPCPERRDQR